MGALLRREIKPTKKEGWASYDKKGQQVLKPNPFTERIPPDEFRFPG